MSDFTFVELHLHGLDVPELPFGRPDERESGRDRSSPAPAAGESVSRGSRAEGLRSRIPTRLLVGVVILLLAIGAVVAAKLLGGEALEDFAEEY